MSDTAPVNMDTTATTSTGYMQCYTDQSVYGERGPWERRAGTDGGDQFRPTPVPGPGRRFQRSENESAGDELVGDEARGASSAQERWDGQSKVGSKKDNLSELGSDSEFLALKFNIFNKAKDDEVVVSSENHLKRDAQHAIPSESTLKPVCQMQRHLSADSGCCCPGCACNSALKELYRENEGLRIRVKGVETISEILNETREELESEKQKKSKLDIAISNLQSRLHQVGCDTSVDLAEYEIFIPGPDRTFVNSLISENGRLQKQVKELKTDGNAVESNKPMPNKTLEALQKQMQKQAETLLTKETRISTLENLLRSSDDAKTAKIVHLQDEGLRISKELKDAEGTCKMLTSERKRLKNNLADSQNQLDQTSKELAAWKEKAQHMENQISEIPSQKIEAPKMSNLTMADRLKIAAGQVEQLDKENSRLTEQLREVIGMNTRWQRYNEQRETYVLKLTKTNQHQQSKITVLEQQHRDLEQTINGLNVMLQALKDEKRKNTDAAILSLEHQLVQREDRISELAEELSALKMYLQSSENERGIGPRQEDKEMIQTLQQQVKIYRDDFEQERKDRERLQGNNEILRHRLKDTTKKLLNFEDQNARTSPNFTAKVVGSAPGYYEQPGRLIARGISRPSYDDSYLPSDVEVDGRDEFDGPGSNTEPLQCPRCTQEFAVSDHSVFMRHVGICLDQ